MSVSLVTVTGSLETLSGATPSLGRLWFRISRADWNLSGDIFAPEYIEAIANPATGAFSVNLQSTTGLEAGSVYSVILRYREPLDAKDREYLIGKFALPTGGPYQLGDLLGVPVLDPVPADILALCQAYAASADADAADAAASAELARIYSLQAGSYFDETDLEMGSIVIPTEITIISRIPDGASLDQVAVAGELSWWKRTTPPTSQPYFTTSGGVVWTQVGYRESQVLSTVHSALQGAYGSVRNFATRADVLSWIALNPAPAIGSVLNWGGLSVRYLGTGTVISDMAGYTPNGIATPEHHGWTAALSTALQTTKVQEALQAGYAEVLFSGGNTYLVDYVYALVTAPIKVTIRGTIKGSNSAAFLTSVVMRLDGSVANHYPIKVDMSGIFDATLRTNTAGVSSGSGLCIRYTDNWSVTGGGLFYAGESRTSGFGDSGIVPEYTHKGLVDGMFFRGWNDHAIYATAGVPGNAAQYADDLTIVNCHFSQSGAGDIRFARDYHRLKVMNCTSTDSSKLLIVSGGGTNPVTGDQIIVTGNSVDNCVFSAIDIRYTQSASGNTVCGNQIYDWAMAGSGQPGINVRGASNCLIYGNIIKPRAFAQGASSTSCTTGIYITDATGDDGAAYVSRNVSVFGNQIQVFDRSAEAGPPTLNNAINDQTATANIYDNDLSNVYPFDIYTNASGSNGSIGNPLVRRKSSLGVGFGGIIPTRNVTVANHARVTKSDDATRSIDFDVSGTAHTMTTYSPPSSARGMVVDVKTDASNTAPSSGTLDHKTRINGTTRFTIADAGISAVAPLGAWSRTVTQANAITTAPTGSMLYISNEVGGGTVAFYDGTNWRRVQDRVVIA
jgi:hypothetical protein